MLAAPELLSHYRDLIEPSLSDACRFAGGCPDRLGEAIRYAVLAPGKRLRPTLVMMASQACGGDIDVARPSAVAVEMIHAYSLIHDDLPAMDDDDLRRGRPTTHIEFGEATAILAGDALQAEAISHLYRSTPDRFVAAQLMGELAIAAGATGLVGGQEDDLAAERISVDDFGSPRAAREHLESIHRRKTGALFVASVRMGAIAAGGSPEAIASLSRFAELFGLAFQITDDVLDFTATVEQLGKRTQKDHARGKLSFPYLLAAERDAAGSESLLIQGESNGIGYPPEGGLKTRAHADLRAGIFLATQHATSLIADAHNAIALLGTPAEPLHIIADYILERTS